MTHFVSETGRILPKRITNVCAKHQRAYVPGEQPGFLPCPRPLSPLCIIPHGFHAAGVACECPCVPFVVVVACGSLARVIKRSRALNMMPFMHKPHPKLRFSSLNPKPVSTPAVSV